MITRPFVSESDYESCLALQRATWGDDFRELVPPALLMIAEKTGGVAGGAFDADGALIGFVFGVSGIEAGRPIHWSHLLAVRAEHRDRGVGRQLKQWQAERIRANGIDVMYWTFDPLVARNAWVNFHHLGVTSREYMRNLYGSGERSTTDSLIGSDRLVVRWDLTTRSRGDAETRGNALTIEVPGDIQSLKRSDPVQAKAWRASTRQAFERAFADGLGVIGFERTETGGRYLLGSQP
ncbi:MAG: GNAT family N-acetyltransferase [Gemmatimonadales bacterium]